MITWDRNMKSLSTVVSAGTKWTGWRIKLSPDEHPPYLAYNPLPGLLSSGIKVAWPPTADSQFTEFFNSVTPVFIGSNYILENIVQDQGNIHNKNNNYHCKKCHIPTIPQALCWAHYWTVLSNRVAVRHVRLFTLNQIKNLVLYTFFKGSIAICGQWLS